MARGSSTGSDGIEVASLGPCGPLGNNVYLVWSAAPVGSPGGSTAPAIVVDAPLESTAVVIRALAERNLHLEAVVASHSHWDHVAEAGQLAGATGAAVVAQTLDAAPLTRGVRSAMFDIQLPPVAVARELVDGDVITVGTVQLDVVHTPGHTPGSMCLYHAPSHTLFAGDTLFAGSFGRYDLPGGDPAALRQSLLRLALLPPETRVLPGHGLATTIGRERWMSNPPL